MPDDPYAKYGGAVVAGSDPYAKYGGSVVGGATAPPNAPTDAAPAMQKPQGSAVGRFASGLWDTTVGGVGKTVKALADITQTGFNPAHQLSPETKDMLGGLINAHVDQWHKARDAYQNGNYTEAAGHALATALPLVGPAAAHAGERMGGTEAQFDKYGNVVQPGQEPDIAGGLGEATGLLAGALAPEVIRNTTSAVAGKTLPTPRVPSSLNPTEAAAIQFADAEGIPTDLGTRTGNNVVKGAQGLVQNQPGGAAYAQGAKQAQNAALSATGQRIANSVSPTAITAEQSGASVSSALQSRIAALDAQADTAYGALRKLEADPANVQTVQVGTKQIPSPTAGLNGAPNTLTVPDMKDIALPVDMRGVKQSLRPVYDQLKQSMPLAQQQASPGLRAIENVLSGDDYVPASVADRNLSAIKAVARTADSPQLRNVSQGLAAKAINDLDPAVQKAVASANDPNALQYLKNGRQATRLKYETAELASGLSDEPVQVFRRLTSNGDAYVNTLRDVAKSAPQTMPQIGRAYLQGMLDTAADQGGFSHADKLFADWNRLGDGTKQLIFQNPQTVQNLDNFFLLAKRMAESPNPSRTAYVASLVPTVGLVITQPHIGVPLVIGNAGLSRLMFNPTAAQLLSRGLSLPAVSPQAAAVASQIAKIATRAGVTAAVADKVSQDNQTPRFATGGIAGLRGPEKVIVGDGGEPEAIIPLSQLSGPGPIDAPAPPKPALQSDLSSPGAIEPRTIPVKSGKRRGKPSEMPSLAANPTAAQPTTPEAPETLQMQLMQLQRGQRQAVMFPKGTQVPQLPPGVPTHQDPYGNVYAYDPGRLKPEQINAAVAMNRLPEILGDARTGMGAPDKSQLRGPVAAVVGRTMDGTTVQSTASDQDNLEGAIEATKRVTPPGGTVSVEPAQNEIDNRMAAQQPNVNQASDASGEYFRGAWNLDLNPDGRAEAQRIAQATPGQFTEINAGGLRRHQETARTIAATNPQAGPIKVTSALEPWTLGDHEGNRVTPDRVADINDHVINRPDEPLPGTGRHSQKPGESFNQFKDPLIAHVQGQLQRWRPGQKILNVTSGRDVQAVRAWVAAGMPGDRSVDPSVMTAKWQTEPGQMMLLDPRDGRTDDVANAAQTQGGIYFARHGQTDANDTVRRA